MNTYITLNGTNFFPTSIERGLNKVGDFRRAANGTAYYYHRANKNTWTITWNKLRETSLSAITTIGALTASFTFVDEAGTSYTVLVPPGGYSHSLNADSISSGGIFYYDVSLTLEQV